jgi:hypothetical protein
VAEQACGSAVKRRRLCCHGSGSWPAAGPALAVSTTGMVSARVGIPGVHAHHARGLAARRGPPPCRAQGLADGSTGGRGAAARAARPSEGVTVSRRVEAHASALSSADASLDAGDAAGRPRFLPWCRSAQAETRALNYALNGSALALVLVASATELAELVRGDFFSAHAGLEAMRGFLNQGWEVYAHAVDSHPVSTKARTSPFEVALSSKLPLSRVVGTSAHCWVSA